VTFKLLFNGKDLSTGKGAQNYLRFKDTFDLCKQLQLPLVVAKGEIQLIIFDSTYRQFSPLNFPGATFVKAKFNCQGINYS
jgi:hypothetical protein